MKRQTIIHSITIVLVMLCFTSCEETLPEHDHPIPEHTHEIAEHTHPDSNEALQLQDFIKTIEQISELAEKALEDEENKKRWDDLFRFIGHTVNTTREIAGIDKSSRRIGIGQVLNCYLSVQYSEDNKAAVENFYEAKKSYNFKLRIKDIELTGIPWKDKEGKARRTSIDITFELL